MSSPASTRARHRGTAALAAAALLTSLAVAAAAPAAARPVVRPITCTPAATPPIQGSGLGDTAEGFLLENGRFTTIDAPGAAPSTATTGINDRGQIVGVRDVAPATASVRDRAMLPAQNSPYVRMTSNW
jgi:hypothetical protein